MSIRPIRKLIKAKPTLEGAGVPVADKTSDIPGLLLKALERVKAAV